jgi:hypothetical protein
MTNKNLTKEQNQIRNILYGIMALTIFSNFIIFYYALIDQKYSYLISFSLLAIIGIINYVAYKYGLINRRSTISAIITVAIIVTITLLNR